MIAAMLLCVSAAGAVLALHTSVPLAAHCAAIRRGCTAREVSVMPCDSGRCALAATLRS